MSPVPMKPSLFMDTFLSYGCGIDAILGYPATFCKDGFGGWRIATALSRLAMSAGCPDFPVWGCGGA